MSHPAIDPPPKLRNLSGLVPVMRLAERVDLAGLVDARVRPDLPAGANPGGKVAAIVAGMTAGADCIDDLDLLRHGGMKALFDGVYAPSTLGSFLRFFTWGHGLQLEAASRDLLAALAERVVRRVRERNPAPAGQEELFPIWRYHAFLTDTDSSTVEADLTHRAHASQEQAFAGLIDGPLAHLPSGRLAAYAAWLTLAAMAHNLLRAAGCLADDSSGGTHARARAATLRRKLINIPARITRHARRLIIHLPAGWRWRHGWQRLFTNTHSPPATA